MLELRAKEISEMILMNESRSLQGNANQSSRRIIEADVIEGQFEDNYRARFIDDQRQTTSALNANLNPLLFDNSSLLMLEPDTNSQFAFNSPQFIN